MAPPRLLSGQRCCLGARFVTPRSSSDLSGLEPEARRRASLNPRSQESTCGNKCGRSRCRPGERVLNAGSSFHGDAFSLVAVRGQSSQPLLAVILKRREGCGREARRQSLLWSGSVLGLPSLFFIRRLRFLAALESLCTPVNNSFLFFYLILRGGVFSKAGKRRVNNCQPAGKRIEYNVCRGRRRLRLPLPNTLCSANVFLEVCW